MKAGRAATNADAGCAMAAGDAGQVQKDVVLKLLEIGCLEPTKLANETPRNDERGHGVAKVRDTKTFVK